MERPPKANKDLGQHYLKDKSVIEKIINDAPAEYDAIVEVGPGPGVITKELSQKGKPLYLIEMDTRFEPHLNFENIKEIFFQDAMQFNWPEFLSKNGLEDKKIWLVSNLPYNASSQLFVQFLQVEQISNMTLMYQKEVGEKTYYRPGAKNQMNSLLSLASAYTESKQVCKVSPGAFNPPPKVDSVVVTYDRLSSPRVAYSEFKTYESFLRKLFAMKRKQLGSVLKAWPAGKTLLSRLEESGFDARIRAEGLDLDQVFSLFETYSKP
ncbi:MAG: ribosomal RNA small subunit methyltransferase A [Bacteriovoracaceae bacterium]|nr:ribosomal RNA small subunit methyltransferase A [Bacteriovoracaceae bacterium]